MQNEKVEMRNGRLISLKINLKILNLFLPNTISIQPPSTSSGLSLADSTNLRWNIQEKKVSVYIEHVQNFLVIIP